MSIEPFQWLLAQADALGYQAAHVGPASVDLCLGACASASLNGDFLPYLGGVYDFKPHTFYLCATEEYIKVPLTHCAMINMRSSWARKGLGHKMAGFIDPGFEGQITLELETTIPVTMHQGERIVQLIYLRLTEPTQQPYQGKYLGQRGPTEAYKE